MLSIKTWFLNVKNGLVENFKRSLMWGSVQFTAAWGSVWVIYSQLPADVMAELSEYRVLHLTIVTWMALLQAITTYLARVKK